MGTIIVLSFLLSASCSASSSSSSSPCTTLVSTIISSSESFCVCFLGGRGRGLCLFVVLLLFLKVSSIPPPSLSELCSTSVIERFACLPILWPNRWEFHKGGLISDSSSSSSCARLKFNV